MAIAWILVGARIDDEKSKGMIEVYAEMMDVESILDKPETDQALKKIVAMIKAKK